MTPTGAKSTAPLAVVGSLLFGLALGPAIIGSLLFGLALEPASATPIAPSEAASHVGESITVEGVANVHVSRNATFIDIGGKYPSQPFSAVVLGNKRQAVFGDLTRYDGKVVDAEGTVRMFRGKPEIILNDPSELRAK